MRAGGYKEGHTEAMCGLLKFQMGADDVHLASGIWSSGMGWLTSDLGGIRISLLAKGMDFPFLRRNGCLVYPGAIHLTCECVL